MSANWHDVKTYGAVGDGVADDTGAIQAALNAAQGGGTVEIPKGNYRVTTFLVVRGDTTVHAYGARIFSGYATRGVLRNFDPTDVFAAYAGNSNIKILGGIWDGNAYKAADGTGLVTGTTNVMCFIHCENILVRDVTVRDCSGAHGLEFNAVSHGRVESCRFEGFADNTTDQSRLTSEAMQVDIANPGSSSIGLFDDTPCKDVSITNCWFGPSARLGAYGRAVGSHTIVTGVYYDRISMRGCEVLGGYDVGILATGWRDSEISGNKFWSTGSYAVKADRSARVSLLGNHVYGHGLLAIGSSEIVASNNQIRSSVSNAINMAGITNGVVSGNLISGTTSNHGITVGTSAAPGSGTLVSGNTVYDAASAGIRVSSPNTTVTGNLVRSTPTGVSVSASGVALLANDLRDTTTAISGTATLSGNLT